MRGRGDVSRLLGKHVLTSPTGYPLTRIEPMPHDFRPKHCAGALDSPTSCLHLHPGDEACGCGQAVLPPDGAAVVLQLRPHNVGSTKPAPFIRHSLDGCHVVSPFIAAGSTQ